MNFPRLLELHHAKLKLFLLLYCSHIADVKARLSHVVSRLIPSLIPISVSCAFGLARFNSSLFTWTSFECCSLLDVTTHCSHFRVSKHSGLVLSVHFYDVFFLIFFLYVSILSIVRETRLVKTCKAIFEKSVLFLPRRFSERCSSMTQKN